MTEWLRATFSQSEFMPHGHCYLWRPALVWAHVSSDFLIGGAYVGISLTLWALIRKIKLPFSFVVLCFGLFIAACGATHFMEIWNLWYPDYWAAAGVKVLTAIASVGTGIYLYRLRGAIVHMAEAAKLSERRRVELEALTKELEARVSERAGAAERNAREFAALFRSAAAGMAQADARTRRLVRANPKFCEILGYSEAELLTKTIDDITIEEERAADRINFYRLVHGPDREHFYEKQYRHKDGHGVWAAVGVTFLYDGQNLPYASIAVIYDITRRREAEAALKASELRYRTLTETLPQLVWTALPSGQCDYLSQQWVDYTGVPMSEQVRLGWLDSIHPEDRARTSECWLDAVAGRSPYDLEYRIQRKDGMYRWFKTRGTPVHDAHGEISYWFGTCTDVHDLRETRQKLEEAVRARDEFLSLASHELKTPLTSLRLQSQFFMSALRRDDPAVLAAPRVTNFVEQSEKQVERLAKLVDDMLDIARIRSGHLTLQHGEFDLAALLLELAAHLDVSAVKRHGPVHGEWDRGKIEQVVGNLITNAVRYGRGQPVRVGLETDNEHVTFCVQDHGIGIAPAAQAKIFDRFERAVDAREVSGLGLGLFISKQIVEAHGEKIWVHSQPERGATFYVRLPRFQKAAQTFDLRS